MRAFHTMVFAGACAARPIPAPVTAPPPPPPPPPAPAAVVAVPVEAGPAPAPPPMPYPMLAQPGELFMLVVDHGKPVCQAWTIDPHASSLSMTVGPLTRSFQYSMRAAKLNVAGPDTARDGMVIEGTTCSEDLNASETADGLAVDDAIWFRTSAGCTDAIAKHARVATAMRCEEQVNLDSGTDAERGRTRDRFEQVAKRGGTLYGVEDKGCIAIRWKPYPKGASQAPIAGDMSFPIADGIETYGYEMAPGDPKITLLGPSEKYKDGSESAMGCMDELELHFAADSVTVRSQLFFTLARCRAQVAEDHARDSWFPPKPTESSLTAAPLVGGC